MIGQRGTLRGRVLDRPRTSASVIKAMLLVAYLNRSSVRGRALTGYERGLLGPMIQRSKNEPATTIFHRLGPAPLYALAERAGMRNFRVDSHWGLSDLTARDQALFFRRIDLLVPERHRAYARMLLATIIPRQRWGIPPEAPDGLGPLLQGRLARAHGRLGDQPGRAREARASGGSRSRSSPRETRATPTAERRCAASRSGSFTGSSSRRLSSRPRSVKIAHRTAAIERRRA